MIRNIAKTAFLTLIIYCLASPGASAQKKEEKYTAVLSTQQEWKVYDVKSKKPEFEIGETLKFRIDGNFYYEQNNYAKRGGDWMITKNDLVLVFDSFTEKRKRIPISYQIKTLKDGKMVLKYRNMNRKKETIYLK